MVHAPVVQHSGYGHWVAAKVFVIPNAMAEFVHRIAAGAIRKLTPSHGIPAQKPAQAAAPEPEVNPNSTLRRHRGVYQFKEKTGELVAVNEEDLRRARKAMH